MRYHIDGLYACQHRRGIIRAQRIDNREVIHINDDDLPAAADQRIAEHQPRRVRAEDRHPAAYAVVADQVIQRADIALGMVVDHKLLALGGVSGQVGHALAVRRDADAVQRIGLITGR
jgi:hypothetical protein